MTSPNGAGPDAGPGGDPVPTPATLADVLADNAADVVSLTDRGNGRRFADMYRHIVRYVADRDEWVVRAGTHWVVDRAELRAFALTAGVTRAIREEALAWNTEDERARDRVLAYAVRTESEKVRRTMLSTARENPELVVLEEDLDANPDEVATPDGIVNLLTGEFRPATPDDLCTMHTSVSYDPDATSPELDLYLDTFVPDEDDRRVLWAILGTSLRGGNPGRLFPVLIGKTTTGKSQLIAALDRLLGGYICAINASVFRGNLDDKPRPDLVRAMGRRIAYAVEASQIWELHADQVKRLTGGDPVPYRNLYSQSEERVPRFTPLIVTNEMPRVKGADQALRRRMLTFTFDRSLPAALEDPDVKHRFTNDEGCLRAILARVVAGARDEWLRDGVRWDKLPIRYAAATLESFGQLDHVDEFLEWLRDREVLEVVDAQQTPLSHCAKATEMHEWYTIWVKKHGDRQDKAELLNLKAFNQALRDRGWASKPSAGVRWIGIRLASSPGLWAT